MNKLNIPKTIHVGYQEREGTYTGQLAYVIYTDEKGKKRKEGSWNSWRSKKIEPQDFDNEPTSGFVLNKGVGGVKQSYGWNPRNEYIRVYDPRGHEFEISVANLLFILQECTSTKGKGLEGEFVYAWDGTELILLPTSCPEYTASSEFTALKVQKVTAKEMLAGCTYQTKQMEEWLYLGRLECKAPTGRYADVISYRASALDKRHVFYNLKSKQYEFEKGFTKLATKLTDTHPDFADKYMEFKASGYASKLKQVNIVAIDTPVMDMYHNNRLFLVKKDEDTYICTRLGRWSRHYPNTTKSHQLSKQAILGIDNADEPSYYYRYGYSVEKFNKVYPNAECFTIEYELESGTIIGAHNFIKRPKN